MKIEVEKPTGVMVIKETIKGVTYEKRYMGYSEKEAVTKFNRFVKNKR